MEALRDEIGHFMTFDGHTHPDLSNSYFVRSLYFDNLSADNYYQKIDGVKTRRKFRIRTYDKQFKPDTPLFLEEKGRHNERTYKTRHPIRFENLGLFLKTQRIDELISLLDLHPDVPVVEQFVFECLRRRLVPRVLVDYVRQPYVSDFDMNFRITLDSSLRAAAVAELFPREDAAWRLAEAGYTIVEVKFDRRVPAWFHRLIQTHNLRRLSISKFCRGMEICCLAENLE